jgi:NAD(P)-dependent dehydrogenase (short-subunit alcohol dehydrogenase family)
MTKLAWITGGSSGIGLAVAECLLGRGWKVVISGRGEEAVQDAARKLGDNAFGVVADVADAEAMAAAAKQILDRESRIDALIVNAGMNVGQRAWGEVTAKSFQNVIVTNLVGAFISIDAVLKAMRASGGGRIVAISSFAGWYVTPQPGPAYSSSKMAMRALVDSVNMAEMRNGITATAICPGEVATPIMQKRVPPPTPDALARMLQPIDVGEAVAFVLQQPDRVAINELVITPSWNNAYNRVPGPPPTTRTE